MPKPRALVLRSATVLLAATVIACSSPGPSPSPVPPTPEAPSITCPASVTQQSPIEGPLAVSYATPVPVNGSTPVGVSCAPASGTSFSPGATTVTCTATDAIARTATCQFKVTVTTPPRLQKTRFCAFGDSMTVGILSLRAPVFSLVPSSTSYPGRLQVLLTSRYALQTVTVDDEGVQGELAIKGMRRLPGVLSATRPEVVLLMHGANDLAGFGESGLDDTAWAVDQMVVASIDSGAVPLVATLPPEREGGFRAPNAALVPVYNAKLAAVASASHTTLVDLYAAFGGTASNDLIGPDGLHPTEAGYQKIAETFLAAIQATLEAPYTAPTAARRATTTRR